MRANITSAAGILALIQEPEQEIKAFALKKLDGIVDVFWAEIAEAIDKIEVLHEDEGFKYRHLAALVTSKVYYHLGDYDDSLHYALGADHLFDVSDTSEYVETTIAKCIDHYIKLRVHNESSSEEQKKKIDPRLEHIVNRMFQRCFDDRQFKQAVGIALECRRLDIFKDAIFKSQSIPEMLSYSLKVILSLADNRLFRDTILKVLVDLYLGLATPDFISVCQCLIFLDNPTAVAEILEKLVRGPSEKALVAYQVAFDLYESATQQFLKRVGDALRNLAPPEPAAPAKSAATAEKAEDKTTEQESKSMDTTEGTALDAPAPPAESAEVKELRSRANQLQSILRGDTTIGLHLQFLIRTSKADIQILKQTKETVRNSICHNACVIGNAYMHAGTTSDQFLRDNLEWLSRATNWARFTATASLGVIHHRHEKEALQLMSTYLPKESGPGSIYSEGGGLFALGLIHVNHGGEIIEYLLNQLKEATSDVVRHGACLGLGLAAMGSAREDVYELLKTNLMGDDAVTGEAAGLAMGLVMLGTKSAQALEDMVQYAQDTQHEKILRGLAVGISLTMYGRLEEADTLIETLYRDKDPILRWSSMYTVAMAYAGTSNNKAVQRLLHVAVSDVNDDVRRSAVIALGFLLFRNPEQCLSVVSLLSESYNPHLRYGAAMALGIACAGTANKEAIAILEPMTNDPVNHVRQGALIAVSMVMVQQNEITCPKTKAFREMYAKIIADKHEDVMAKFGCILAQGILDAGGRNVTINLQTRTGHTNMVAAVGLLVFQQFWYWYPLAHTLCLAFTPTAIIGLNDKLQMPKFDVRSNARPSTFAYPPPLEEKKDKKGEKVETAVLSVTAKAKRKEAEKKKDDGDEAMDVDDEKKDVDQEKESVMSEESAVVETLPVVEEVKKPEPHFEMLSNPARVMHCQLKYLTLPEDCRFSPLKDVATGGIIMLADKRPSEAQEIVENVAAGGPKSAGDTENEPEPPEPFEWDPKWLE